MKKRQSTSSIVSIIDEEESLDILSEDKKDDDKLDHEMAHDSYIDVEINTDNIEDIVSSAKMGNRIGFDDVFIVEHTETTSRTDFELPKGVEDLAEVELELPEACIVGREIYVRASGLKAH